MIGKESCEPEPVTMTASNSPGVGYVSEWFTMSNGVSLYGTLSTLEAFNQVSYISGNFPCASTTAGAGVSHTSSASRRTMSEEDEATGKVLSIESIIAIFNLRAECVNGIRLSF